eukprot:Gb_39244 [translate_table: standard]
MILHGRMNLRKALSILQKEYTVVLVGESAWYVQAGLLSILSPVQVGQVDTCSWACIYGVDPRQYHYFLVGVLGGIQSCRQCWWLKSTKGSDGIRPLTEQLLKCIHWLTTGTIIKNGHLALSLK